MSIQIRQCAVLIRITGSFLKEYQTEKTSRILSSCLCHCHWTRTGSRQNEDRKRERNWFFCTVQRQNRRRQRETGTETDRQTVSQRERERPRYRQTENYVVWFTTTFRKGSKKLRDWSELRGRHLLRRFLNGDPPSSRPMCAFSLTLPFFLLFFLIFYPTVSQDGAR